VETTRLVLSLADLQAFDPYARVTQPESRFLCPGCGGAKPRDAEHRCLCANVETGLWRCCRCGAAGQLREWWKEQRLTGQGRRRPAPKTLSPRAAAKGRARATTEWQPPDSLQPLAGTPGAEYLARRGIPVELAVEAGVLFAPDWYGRPAVVFLLRDASGNIVGAQGRHTDGRENPKAHNSTNAGAGVFATPGAWEADTLILCEGPIDALSLAAAGFPAVALLGTSYPNWLRRRSAFRRVLLAHDPDKAGDDAAGRLFPVLRSFGARPDRVRPEGANDWNDLLQARGIEGLREAVLRELEAGASGPVPALEGEAAHVLLTAVYRRIGQTVPAGAITWANAHQADLMAAADEAEARFLAASEAGSSVALSAAAADLIGAYEAIGAAFISYGSVLQEEALGDQEVIDDNCRLDLDEIEEGEMMPAGRI
jgi:hypothetical protein